MIHARCREADGTRAGRRFGETKWWSHRERRGHLGARALARGLVDALAAVVVVVGGGDGGVLAMAGKAKPKKHTAKELQAKAAAALTNKGGGAAGLVDRKGGAAGHAKFKCPVCGMAVPSEKSGIAHWDSKHPKLTFDFAQWTDQHAVHGGTTQGVAVRGAAKDKSVAELQKTAAGREELARREREKKMVQY